MMREDNKDWVFAICRRQMKAAHYRVFLFGSRAACKAFSDSDYDIGIEAERLLTGKEKVKISYDLKEPMK